MFINDVKKGWQVSDTRGVVYRVHDNAKGLRRMVCALPGQGLFQDIGSMYAFDWVAARPNTDSGFEPVQLTPRQEKEAKEIKMYMG